MAGKNSSPRRKDFVSFPAPLSQPTGPDFRAPLSGWSEPLSGFMAIISLLRFIDQVFCPAAVSALVFRAHLQGTGTGQVGVPGVLFKMDASTRKKFFVPGVRPCVG